VWFHAKIFVGEEGRGIVRRTAYMTQMKDICRRIIAMRKPRAVVPYFAIFMHHDVIDLAVSNGKWQAFAL
jgi:hypothetical protein